VKIEETLTIEIYGLEDGHPWEADDYRINRLRQGLSEFVRRVADTYAKSPGESELILLAVAKDIFDSVRAAVAEILRERLLRTEKP